MNALRGSMQVLLEGRGPLTLRPADHIATGGEGSLYRAKGTVIKVYTDVTKMRRDRMDAKVSALADFTHPYIIAPEGLVRDAQQAPIGFYMPFFDGEPLARVFTNSYWQREGFKVDDASQVVARMREAMQYAHGKGALMVDPNELNWIVTRGGVSSGYVPHALDVDSWALDSWKPAVIMPSIRDYHATSFTKLSDWFAWGVVTFQVYTGIHPYKGTLRGFAMNDMVARMQTNASVFRKEVRLNRAVRELSTIPARLLDWYEATFEQGERTEPPSPFDTGRGVVQVARTLRMVTSAQGALIYRKLFERVQDPVVEVYPAGVALLRSGALIQLSTQRTIATGVRPGVEVGEVAGGWVVAGVESEHTALTCYGAQGKEECPLALGALRMVSGAGRLFALGEQGLQEVQARLFGARAVASVGTVWPIMPRATAWFGGVGVMDALGAMHLVVPFGERGVTMVRVKELDSVRVLAGEGSGRIVVLTAVTPQGTYERYTVLFDHAMQTCQVTVRTVDTPDQNVTVLPKGVVVSIEEDGELTITVPTSGVVHTVSDKDIATDMALTRWGDKVLYVKGGTVWSLEMK
ncbi:MAG: hypothetical protein KBD21_04215 [Candidatus Pacebacteria bacterium]|nr:hypothetical protein [Candidatus Paceibacterota bacterium]